ncbi:aspartyl protease family protein [Dyella tabacisoli]|uniref:PDZ domain-containing protein n=1 Tax=Dyella tabacisoli TaxID=2282381 RepID=A0A369UJR9_9GAMM|nr:aspartyl protease family protein [Dyella tabacisoli]RDD80767.1 PDZ domain-containing protein [Dyella tabacisoli]
MHTISRSLSCLLLAALPAFATASTTDTTALLREVRQAYGGDSWIHVGGLVVEGKETADGLIGESHKAVDLRNGYYSASSRNPVFAGADGFDAQGRWHQDISGLIHPLDSDEAKTVAISENWLGRFGFLHSQSASFRPLADGEENGHRYTRLEATPKGGRAVTLWIDPTTHRLDRAVWQSSFLTQTQRYSDYRTVNGLLLPFRINSSSATVIGTADGDSVESIDRYRLLPDAPVDALQRPDGKVRDVTMANGAPQATTPMHLEGGTLLIEVSINGKGPLPFILDTGGHAILTTDAAKKLGFQTQGSGTSTGSGPGSMSTAYTKVEHLTIGAADIRDQTFLVMPYPYEFYQRGEGREPIAGILGLEIFERFAVTFDYDRQQLILQPYDRGEAPAAAKGDVLPLRFTDDMPLTDMALDGHRGIFGVDTGNSGLLLTFPQWAERNGIADRYAQGAPIPTGGVGGMFTAHIAHARSVQLGEQKLDNVVAMLTRFDAGATGNPSEAGNLGQDLLARFNVHFDYRRQHMVLMPRAAVPAWHYAMAGYRASKKQDQPDRYQVGWVMPDGPAAKAGLKKDDVIVAVNGKPAAALGFDDLRELSMNRPEGTPLKLSLADGRALDMNLHDVAPK